MLDRWHRLRAGLSNAFAIEDTRSFSAEDVALLGRIADAIVGRGMGEPAILFLDTCRPLNYIGSQALVFLEPFVRTQTSDYRRLTEILESRAAIAHLVEAIEGRIGNGKFKEPKTGSGV